MPTPKTLACVTMAYNEADMLPIWLRHYGRQVGSDACYVIDHGSTDGSTADLAGAKLLRLGRSVLDETQRAAFVSRVCAGLLSQYNYVAFTDTDELLVADPARWATLAEYVNEPRAPVTTAFGLNLLHRMHHEVSIDMMRPLLHQRAWGFPVASMCKPLLVSRPVRWSPGFHSCDAPLVFDGLFLFHLAYFDYRTALRRQAKRRATPFATDDTATHHRVSDAQVREWMEGWSRMKTVEDVSLDEDCAEMAGFHQRLAASSVGREAETFHIDIGIIDYRLWRIPPRFRDAL